MARRVAQEVGDFIDALNPRMAKSLVAAEQFDCIYEMLEVQISHDEIKISSNDIYPCHSL